MRVATPSKYVWTVYEALPSADDDIHPSRRKISDVESVTSPRTWKFELAGDIPAILACMRKKLVHLVTHKGHPSWTVGMHGILPSSSSLIGIPIKTDTSGAVCTYIPNQRSIIVVPRKDMGDCSDLVHKVVADATAMCQGRVRRRWVLLLLVSIANRVGVLLELQVHVPCQVAPRATNS
jgi:hypothetical protein